MIEAAKITLILIFNNNKWVGHLKCSNKRRTRKCNVLIKKKIHQRGKMHHSVSENSKVYEMDFMKGIGCKSRWGAQYLEVSHCLLVKRWRRNWMIKGFARVCPWMSIRLLRFSFIKGEASSCKRYSSTESVWHCNVDDTGSR